MKFRVAFIVTLFAALVLAVPALASKSVPFKAHATGISGPPPSGPPPWEMYVSGFGVATHLGRTNVYQHMWVKPDPGDPNILDFYDGTFVWTAANGDKLMGTYAGQLIPNLAGGYYEIQGQFVITGGTGRFQDATLGGPASDAQFTDGTFDLRLDGTISYH